MRPIPVFIICCAHLLCSTIALSQLYIDVRSGFARNCLITDVSNLSFVKNQRGTGYSVAFDALYNFDGRMFFQAGFSLCQKNYSLLRTGALSGAHEDYTNTYIQLPISVQWRVPIRKFSFFINAGVYGAYWVYARIKGSMPNVLDMSVGGPGNIYFNPVTYDQKYVFQPKRDNRLEYGWLTGGGFGYTHRPGLFIFVSADYFRSLRDIQKKYMINQTAKYNETYFFSLGCQLSYTYHRHHNHNGL